MPMGTSRCRVPSGPMTDSMTMLLMVFLLFLHPPSAAADSEHWPPSKMRRPEYIAIVISRTDQPQRQVAPQESRQGFQKLLCALGVERSFVPAVRVGCKTKGIVIDKRAMV